MDLASYLLKPVQRMGKYALLLQQMMKACPALPSAASERAVGEQDDLKQAEEMVRFQLRHGNDLLAMDSIRDCDVSCFSLLTDFLFYCKILTLGKLKRTRKAYKTK